MTIRAWGAIAVALSLTSCASLAERPMDAARSESPQALFISQIALHPARPDRVLALTNYSVGLLASADRGRHWETANRGIRSYSLYRLVVDPRDPDVVYVGAGGGGLYRSVDGAKTFAERNDGLGNTNIGAIVLHPTDPDRLYVVTSTGVFVSPDRGASWSAWNEGDHFTQSQQFQDLVIIPGTPDAALLASGSGVWRRRVGDPSWSIASRDLQGRAITVLIAHPDGRRVFAAALRDGATLEGGGLFVSEDGGTTWTRWDRDGRLTREWMRRLWFDARSPLAYAATSGEGVLRSEDGGRTWERRSAGLPTADVRALAIDPDRPTHAYAGTHGYGVFATEDGGVSWRPLGEAPIVAADAIIAALKARDPGRPASELAVPPAFAKCNGCHGWTDPELNQAPHSFWLVPPNRRDWPRTVRRMAAMAGLSESEEAAVADFLTAYSSRVTP
ncbi:MAG: WD40/YVTN/BNR-like repeat-containing protein [Nitrospirota bacterium]